MPKNCTLRQMLPFQRFCYYQLGLLTTLSAFDVCYSKLTVTICFAVVLVGVIVILLAFILMATESPLFQMTIKYTGMIGGSSATIFILGVFCPFVDALVGDSTKPAGLRC